MTNNKDNNDVGCIKTTKIQWSKAYMCIPKEHMIPNKYINCKKFEVSYERVCFFFCIY